MKKIAIVNPIINNYRLEFFTKLNKDVQIDLYTYRKRNLATVDGLSISSDTLSKKLKSKTIGPFLLYDFLPLVNKGYEYIVILGNVKHLSAWLLLIIGKLIGLKVILWGHGISVTRYLNEYEKLPWIRLTMYRLAYGAWFYTANELQLYKKKIKKLVAVNLNNTISEVDDIIKFNPFDTERKQKIKNKYKIKNKKLLIICTRFESPTRKADKLIDVIKGINKEWGLIIIGDGKLKPDFSKFNNVYDFGSIYERSLKSEFFLIADLYIQLGHIGLSVVEAFAYGLPIITLKRSETTHHSVEYNYVIDKKNGFICDNIEDVINRINVMDEYILNEMSKNAIQFVKDNLSMNNMCKKAFSILQETKME